MSCIASSAEQSYRSLRACGNAGTVVGAQCLAVTTHLKHEFLRAAAASHEACAKGGNGSSAAVLVDHLDEHGGDGKNRGALLLAQRLQRFGCIKGGGRVDDTCTVAQGTKIAHHHPEAVVHVHV